MSWAAALAWIMDPKGPPPVSLYKFVSRRVKMTPATSTGAKIRFPKGTDKRGRRETLENALDELCRVFYKKRDIKEGVGRCISCGRLKLTGDLQWGHFIAQGQSQYLRWDPRNFGAQCIRCNILQQGRQVDFGAELDRRYSPGFAEGLRQEAHRHKSWHPSIKDLEDIRTALKGLIQCSTLPHPPERIVP